jgi:hypothetical protein
MRRLALPSFAPYVRRIDADARIASALSAIRALLVADLLPAHRRELLGVCLWKLSLAEPLDKYATRFVSAASLGRTRRSLAHEHVYERAKLVRALIDGAMAPERLPEFAFACVVTREEHACLGVESRRDPSLDGWARYREAGIAVVDRERGCWLR